MTEDASALTGVFDRNDAEIEQKINAFIEELDELQKELGFTHFVRALKEDGDLLTVKIYPASDRSPGARESRPAAADDFDTGRGAFESVLGRTPARDAPKVEVEASQAADLQADLLRRMSAHRRFEERPNAKRRKKKET